MAGTDIDKLITEAAVKQIEKLKINLDEVVNSIANVNKAGAALEAQLASGNLGWAKTIGKMKEITENNRLLEEGYKKLVAANEALVAAENRHNARLAALAETQRTATLITEELIITNQKQTASTIQATTAINAKQKAELKEQITASQGLAVNTRATASDKVATAEMQKQIVTIEMLVAENKKLLAARAALDITTEVGRHEIALLNAGIAENTRLINANTAANVSNGVSMANVGRGLTRTLGYLRTMAYILPGIGIAGIFNIAIMGLTQLFTGFSKATTAQKLLTEAMKEGAKNSAAEVWNLERLYQKATNIKQSIDERREAVDKLQKLFPAYFKNIEDEIILNGGAENSYNTLRQSIIATAKSKAIVGAVEKIINDDLEKELELRDKLKKAKATELTDKGEPARDLWQGREHGLPKYFFKEADDIRRLRTNNADMELRIFKKLQADKIKVLTDALDEQEKLIDDKVLPDKEKKAAREKRGPADMTDNSAAAYIDAERARFMANYELMKKDSEKHAEINKKITEDDHKNLNERHGMLNEYQDYKNRLLLVDKIRGNKEMQMHKKLVDDNEQALFDRQEALAKYYAYKQNLQDLDETKELKEVELHNIAIKNKMAQLQTTLNRGKKGDYNNNILRRELASQQFLYDENLKTISTIQEKYAQERLATTEQFGAANIALIKKHSQEEINITIERWKWIKNFNEQAAKEELELIQGNMDAWANMPDDTDRYPEPTEESKYLFEKKMYYLNSYLELEQAAATIIMGLADAVYAHEIGLIDERERKLNESYDEDKKRIMSSYTNKKEQEEELLKLDARKETLQKQIDRDRKAAARKQAKDQKATDVASIIGSTYVAVMGALGAKPWTFANIAVAAGIGAQGAANLARVIATPLPAYAEGTMDATGGWSVVGDGGKRELVIEPGKNPWVTSNTPTLVNLPKHTKVMSDAELALPLYNAGLIHMYSEKKADANSMALVMAGILENKFDELITETKNNKSNTYIDFVDFGAHNLHVRKNIR